MARSKNTPDPAPHGRDETGAPLAPYGLNIDGTPRKSNRGRQRTPGVRTSTPTVRTNLKDSERKSMLVDLVDMFFTTPLAGVSKAPRLINRIGRRHADALAGDAFILAQSTPALADAAILLAKTRPGLLSWMDKAEENAPYLLLAKVGSDMVKAFIQNHLNPNPALADAGRNLAMLRMAQMAEAVNAEADRIARAAAAAEQLQAETTTEFAAF
jgi:hypothetical protein